MRQINHMTATHKRILRNLIYPQRRSWRYYAALQGVWGVNSKCFALDILDLEKFYQIQTHFGTWKKYSSEASQKNRQKIDGRPPINPTVIYAPHRKLNICLLHGLAFNQKGILADKFFFWLFGTEIAQRSLMCKSRVENL